VLSLLPTQRWSSMMRATSRRRRSVS